jgi:hypothetical protein
MSSHIFKSNRHTEGQSNIGDCADASVLSMRTITVCPLGLLSLAALPKAVLVPSKLTRVCMHFQLRNWLCCPKG